MNYVSKFVVLFISILLNAFDDTGSIEDKKEKSSVISFLNLGGLTLVVLTILINWNWWDKTKLIIHNIPTVNKIRWE